MTASRGLMLYASAAVVGLLGLGHPGPAKASDPAVMQPSVVLEAAAVTATATMTMMKPASAYWSAAATGSPSPAAMGGPETCQFKTINYITHTLPQQCLRTAWSSANATSAAAMSDRAVPTVVVTTSVPATETTTSAATATTATAQQEAKESTTAGESGVKTRTGGHNDDDDDDDDGQDLATGTFMSFEQWRVLQLQKAGQDPADLQARRRQHGRGGSGGGGGSSHADIDSIGDDGEISLDFDVLNEKVTEMADSAAAEAPGRERQHQADGHGMTSGSGSSSSSSSSSSGSSDGSRLSADEAAAAAAAHNYRSKDAGKTGKERFSFASFDAGATVLKTSKGAKNAKSILVENKDSYMLLECNAADKSVIVELSDDILVDTVVLANFEFFSSMVRRFRVSVSDRYPAKADRWRTLGEYEARNLRGIQPFLIENPQIWARYIRIDFLSHYGNEYYCPISLLRVHGTRMLDSWKEIENGHDEDEDEDDFAKDSPKEQRGHREQPAEQQEQQHKQHEKQQEKQQHRQHEQQKSCDFAVSNKPNGTGCTSWRPIALHEQLFALPTCPKPSPPGANNGSLSQAETAAAAVSGGKTTSASTTAAGAAAENPSSSYHSPSSAHTPTHTEAQLARAPRSTLSDDSGTNESLAWAASIPNPNQHVSWSISSQLSTPGDTPISAGASTNQPSVLSGSVTTAVTTGIHADAKPNFGSGSVAAAPLPGGSPTVQESFFKSVTKRLQLLESNTSLSLQYIEDQSRFLQETLRKMERKQITRVDGFLYTLNRTVLSELSQMRQQYDQIWQSTVLALETQREQNQRETVALSDRLNVLADEVVFQKRMAILQSVLLLCCLALVIFSRGLAAVAGIPAIAGSNPLFDQNLFPARTTSSSGVRPPPQPESAPTSPPYSVGLRRNLRYFRDSLRSPGLYSAYSSAYLSGANSPASSPPPPPPGAARTVGPVTASRLPANTDKILPLTPTTPTSPVSMTMPSPEPEPDCHPPDNLPAASAVSLLDLAAETATTHTQIYDGQQGSRSVATPTRPGSNTGRLDTEAGLLTPPRMTSQNDDSVRVGSAETDSQTAGRRLSPSLLES